MAVPAYQGKEKYIFASYAHADRVQVEDALTFLSARGLRIWYDEGIEAGDDWSEKIAGRLSASSVLVYFMGRNLTDNIRRELALAEAKGIPVITVLLGNFPLSPEQEKLVTVNQYLKLSDFKTYGGFAEHAAEILEKYEVSGGEQTEVKDRPVRTGMEPEKKKRTIIIAAAAGAALFAVILIVSALFKVVPDVRGLETADAGRAVEDAGFNATISLNYSDDYEYGVIFEQSAEGKLLKFIPVVLTQSLGPKEDLTDVPDVTGQEISDGAKALIEAGLKKFTVQPETESSMQLGYISAQSIPAGLRVSKKNTMGLDVRTDGGEYTFTVNGREYTLSGTEALSIDLTMEEPVTEEPAEAETLAVEEETEETGPLDLNKKERFGMTDAEWKLFYENNRHTVWEPESYRNVWLPAADVQTVKEHPEECYGWVIVRNMELDAEDLFSGYSELYVCPGITVTVKGNVKEKDGYQDYYVAAGGKLIFEGNVNGGLYLANDGTVLFKGNLTGGTDGALIGNRGEVTAEKGYGKGVTVWSFYESSLTGEDLTGGTLHDYSPYRQLTASGWYEGCSGEKGLGMILDKLEIFAGYDFKADGGNSMEIGITPVINPEDYEDHYQEEWYTSMYLFLSDYTLSKFRQGRGQYWEVIAAPGVTLTVEGDECHTQLVAEKGSTVIINGNMRTYYPYFYWLVNDGTMILNGNYVNEDGSQPAMLMNRGDFTANGTFGGARTYAYNFAGSSFKGNILDSTYVVNADFEADYRSYGNDRGSAIAYDTEVLTPVYGYKNKYTDFEE